ncbi:FIG010773: NAD-dependent epimerase/dehydratase [hydrothermal vent metagenome]|uniref:FIG010773: NAD-dependent epimerase/dehydratase n=1 Tax=hydrothermal vent metagenome TaxID=652676 RepID=A0A3B0ZGW8_9ZZZZ
MSRLVAVTGATGFIGQTICRVLLSAGFDIRVLVRSPNSLGVLTACVENVVQGDLHDPQALKALVAGTQAVIHCAGVVRGACQDDFDKVNVEGVDNLLTAIKAADAPPRLFYLSSLAAREPTLSFYARSKYRSEQLLAASAGDLSWLALRPPAVYGPGDREMLPLFKIMSRGIAPVPGPRDARFSMVYVEDIAQLVLAWLQQDVTASGIYALDDGKVGGYDWDDVSHAVAQLCQRRVHALKVPAPVLDIPAWCNRSLARLWGYAPMLTPEKLRELRHPDWVCDNRALQTIVDWQPHYLLEQGLAKMPGWCARQGMD